MFITSLGLGRDLVLLIFVILPLEEERGNDSDHASNNVVDNTEIKGFFKKAG